MSRLSNWIHALSGAGALANAAIACQQQRDEAALLDARLARIAPPPEAVHPGL
jgi:hypothetical protein